MIDRVLADVVLLLHAGFVVFVVAGGLAVVRWPRLAWLHLPAALWGAVLEIAGWICPLTPLENRLRQRAGRVGYSGGFVEHYLVPAIYPPGLTGGTQLALGVLVVVVNTAAYAVVIARLRRRAAAQARDGGGSPVDQARPSS